MIGFGSELIVLLASRPLGLLVSLQVLYKNVRAREIADWEAETSHRENTSQAEYAIAKLR